MRGLLPGALDQGRTLGRYELLVPVGRGGMGIVWAARLLGTRGFRRTVAVKTMLPSLGNERHFERMFLQEADVASRIKHPNVCPILDLGEERGVLYLVMEWVDGDPLATLLEMRDSPDGAVPYGVAAMLIAKAARGLQAAHELRDESGNSYSIVHRDVSPHNILVTTDGLVQMVDFGIAKAAMGTGHLTRSGYIKGKVAYLAPEQVQGAEIDGRADVFALGTVLYELATGRHPFRTHSEFSTLLRIGAPDPAPPPAPFDFPDVLRRVLDRALQKNVPDRYPTMRAFASDLEACAAKLGGTDDAAAAFLAGALGEKKRERSRLLQSAIRAADVRPENRSRPSARTNDPMEPGRGSLSPRSGYFGVFRNFPKLRTGLVASILGCAVVVFRLHHRATLAPDPDSAQTASPPAEPEPPHASVSNAGPTDPPAGNTGLAATAAPAALPIETGSIPDRSGSSGVGSIAPPHLSRPKASSGPAVAVMNANAVAVPAPERRRESSPPPLAIAPIASSPVRSIPPDSSGAPHRTRFRDPDF